MDTIDQSSHHWKRVVAIVLLTLMMGSGLPARSEAANEALLKLLQVLRDRGSISEAEYEAIKQVADAPEGAPAASDPSPPPAQPQITLASSRTPQPAPVDVMTAKDLPPLVNKVLANKWYERVGLRGYTQFRYADVLSREGAPIEVPADRSVNENESFGIRRGRFIFSGDLTGRLYLYAQMDFNASTGAADYSLQMRDLYADVALDTNRAWRLRFGQSKVPYGFVNMQSSQNRAPLERPDALNSAVEGERDLGAALMWASPEARRRFRDLTGLGLKGSGDYGVVSIGAYSGQGLNRSDQNGDAHAFARVSYPFKLKNGQYLELGIQGHHGRFVAPTQAIAVNGVTLTPTQRMNGVTDQRLAVSGTWYPQPFGIETEWTWGRGPELSEDFRSVDVGSLHGGYVQAGYLFRGQGAGSWFPFSRWHYFDGARKFARNAPRTRVNELDFGLEFARWSEFEITGMFTHTFRRTRTSSFPFTDATSGNRIGLQVQWNY